MKKAQKEKINIILSEHAKKEPESLNVSTHYQEMQEMVEDIIKPVVSEDKKREFINSFLEVYVKKIEDLLQKFYFMELFFVSINKDQKVSLIRENLKERIKYISTFIKEISERYTDDINFEDLNILYSLVNKYIEYFKETREMVFFVKDNYYKNIKTISYAAFGGKKSFELELLCRETEAKLREFKNIEEVYDYCSYYSGDLIVETVNALVECFKKSNNREYIKTYNYKYFLDADIIMQFDFLKWVNLFNKIKYVMNTTSNVEIFDFLKFDTLYRKLEKRYLLVLIYNETQSNKKGNY